MKRKLFIVSLIAIFFVCIFSLSAPRVLAEELTDQEKVDQEIENIYVPSTAIIDFPVVHVSVYDSVITWESSNQELLNVPQNGGWVQVTRPEEDTVVTLTVTIKNNEATASKKFEVTVLKGNTLTNTYNITYVLNGGTNNDQNPKSYKVGTEPSILAPTNGNIKFLGWYDNEEFEGEAITKLPHGLTGDYKLYAKWEEVKLTSIEVTKNPVLKYTAKEEFDATGIEVYAVYSDGSKELVDSSKLSYSIEGQSDLTIHGDTKEVIVSFEGVSTKVALESVELLQYNIEGLFTEQSKEYNGKSQEYTLPKLPEGLTAKTSGTAKDAGTAKVKVLFESLDKDYEAPDSIEVDLTITKAKLTVKPTDVYVTVGATMPKFTVTFVGLLGDDDESLFGELEVSTNATDTNTLGEYKLTVKEFEANNYEVTFQEGKLVVQSSTYTIYVPEEQLNVVYNGKNQMFTASVKDGDKVLPITDIVYEYGGKQFSGATDAGTYEVTISYHHETYGDGKLAVKFNIAKYEFDVNTLKFEDKALEYNGQVQNILVEGNLPEGIKVTYSDGAKDVINNKLIVATFEGTENYTFKNGVKTLEAYLTIEPKALDSSMFDAIPEQDYTGKEITPVVKGSYAGVNFDMTLDFTVKYENNINEGQAKVIITAKENTNFKGTVELTFSIGKTPLVKVKDARIELEGKYTGELVSSLVTEATNGSKVDWLSTSTALSIKDGKVTTIQTNEVQVVVVYGLITYADETGQAAEYVKLEFTIPALGGTTPEVPVDPNPDDPEPDDPVDRTFEQLSDASKITDGTVIVIADESDTNVLSDLYTNGKYFTVTPINKPSMAGALTITLVKAEGGYKLKLDDGQYIYYTGSDNRVYVGEEQEDGSDIWAIKFENNLFEITNKNNSERLLQYNATSGQERFACYKGTQKNLIIYADPETLGEGTTEPEEPVEPTISSITYVLDGGTLSDGAPTEYEEGKGVATLPTATKEGYEFKGWTLNGQAATSISATQTGNVELTAVWEEEQTEEPSEPQEITIEEAIIIGSAKEHNTYTEEKYILSGTILEVQNTQYGNIVISDGTNQILVYGLYSIDGSVRYDSMTVKPVVGDTVTVLGVLGQYSSSAQMKNGWLQEHTAHEHNYSEGKCTICEAIDPEHEHNYSEGKCTICGEADPDYEAPEQPSVGGALATFEFGDNGSEAHVDGNSLGTSKEYSEGNYKLTLENMSSVYGPAYDAKGNSCIKLGTSSKVGSFAFTVSSDVTKVVIKVAQYKTNATKVNVNGVEYTITTASNNGEYTEITVDTTTNKTVTFTTVSGGVRAMVNSIAYYGTSEGTDTPVEPHEHVYVEGKCECGAEDPNYEAPHEHVYVEGKCECGAEDPNYVAPEVPEEPQEITIAEAITIGSAKEHNTYTEEKYILSGTILEVQNTQYGNIVISDGTNQILVYGLYSIDGSVRYDSMTVKPVVGDTVTVLGVLGQYSSSAQMKNGWLQEHTAHEHNYSEGKCTICEAIDPEHEHNYSEGKCTICGEADPDYEAPEQPSVGGALATFEFGDNGSEAHVDGNSLGTSKEYSEGNYKLTLENMSSVYGPAYDAKGNSCIKLGTSSKVGSFAFTVSSDVTKVVIKVAQYKTNATKVNVNGVEYTITTASNNGEYTEITVDTTTNKTVTFTTVSGGVRAMVNSIAYYGEGN